MIALDTIRQFIQTHPRKAAVLAVAVILSAGLTVWVLRFATSGRAPSPIRARQSFPSPTTDDRKPTATPTPTPRPDGPGDYACAPEGVCNLYSDEVRNQYCTTTYADPGCLDACGDAAKRCTK